MEEFWAHLPSNSQNGDSDEATGHMELSLHGLEEVKKFLNCSEGNLLPGMNSGAPGLKFHQLYAISWLVHQLSSFQKRSKALEQPSGAGFLIADAPGLGKTLVVLGFLAHFASQYANGLYGEKIPGIPLPDVACGPVVITCPSSIQSQWQAEAKKWIPPGAWEFLLYPKSLDAIYHWWDNVYAASVMPVYRRVIIISHTMLTMHQRSQKASPHLAKGTHPTIFSVSPWLTVVDEAHVARNTGTHIFKAITKLSHNSACRILLTATPIHNQMENILSLVHLLGLNLSIEEDKIIKKLRTLLPEFRRKARQHLHSEVLPMSHNGSVHSLSPDDSTLSDQIGFGKEFLQKTVGIIKYIIRGHYLRRDHDTLDWENRPLLQLPPKIIINVEVLLNVAEQEWYESEQRASKLVLAMAGGGNAKVS